MASGGYPAGPLVYFTLGTVFDMESGDLVARALAGLSALPVNVVATFGDRIDAGPQPPNVRIESHIPHGALLPHCDAVVSHGGSGTMIDALAAGVPQVVLPIGADQPLNAARCEALGAGIVLDPIAATLRRHRRRHDRRARAAVVPRRGRTGPARDARAP